MEMYVKMCTNNDRPYSYNDVFMLHELKQAIKYHVILYQVLIRFTINYSKHLPDHIWDFPTAWTTVIIIPVPKPDNNNNNNNIYLKSNIQCI